MTEPILSIRQLTKQYGNLKALDEFSADFVHGIYGILGANGAGKSTLMNLISDSISRDSGEILYKGTDILKWRKEFRKKLGVMPQEQGLYEQMSAYSFLMYMSKLKGIPGRDADRQVKELLGQMNLGDVAFKKLGGFSGGMRQRVLLAQALLGNPEILLLDEPTAGLDPQERIRIRNLIAELSENRVILLATHIVSDIEQISGRILLMKQGKLVCIKTAAELTEELTPMVRESRVEPEMLKEWYARYRIGRVSHKADGLYARILGEPYPPEAVPVDGADLEDVYLYYLGESVWEN